MKSNSSSLKFPSSKAEWKKIIAAAPGEERALTHAENAAIKNAVVVKSGGYAAVRAALAEKRRQGERGPQRRPTKQSVTVRFSPEVLAYFKATGEGWQTRMNQVLSEWVAKRQAA